MKYTKSKNLIAAGLTGLVACGSLSSLSAQDLPAPKDVAAAPADAETTASGLSSKVLQAGKGTEKPTARDTVIVHYTGWDKTGKMFDSSITRGEPAEFPLNAVIPGWTEGLQLMVEGEKRRFWIPAAIAYGETPARPGSPAGDLVFDVELITIKKAPEIPAHLKSPAEDAVKETSGLASKVLTAGTGTDKPLDNDTVVINYSNWDNTGRLLTTTQQQGGPATIPLNGIPSPGLVEGLKLMVAGEKRRIWMPAALAYGGAPNAPKEDVIFDVELVSINKAPETPKNLTDIPAEAIATESGVKTLVLTKGTGTVKPTAKDAVKVHYSGWDSTGKMFDSSITRGEPTPFMLAGVLPGWSEGLQLMVPGEKRRIWIPADQAYGKTPERPGAPAGDLVFDVELIEVLPIPNAPADYAKAPEDAIAGQDGIKSKVITPGKGVKPAETAVVKVNYTGWDIKGEVFDTSIPTGDVVELNLVQIPASLKSALILMQEGETRRVWFPSEQIVGPNPQPGAPEGPFCYDFTITEVINPEAPKATEAKPEVTPEVAPEAKPTAPATTEEKK